MLCHIDSILHYALPEVYFAIVSDLGHGELASFSSSRATIRGNIEFQILCLSSSPAINTVLLVQPLLQLFLLGQVWRLILDCFRPRCGCERDPILRSPIDLSDGRGNASRLRKAAPGRHSVSLTLSQTLRCAIPNRLRGRNRGRGLHPAATLPYNAALNTVDLFPFANALMSDSIDSVIVGGERSVSTEGMTEGESHWQHRQRQGKCLGWRCCFGVQSAAARQEGQIRPGGWASGVLKIERDGGKNRREQAAGGEWGF